MEASKRFRRLPDLTRAAELEVEEVLVHWDELAPEALEELATHAVHGPRLRLLQLAEAWLCDQATGDAPPAVARCPASEELYDYGRGPGSTPLPAGRRAEIDRHVLRCGPCRGSAATLVRRPPVPLDLMPREAPVSAVRGPLPGRGSDGGGPLAGPSPAAPHPLAPGSVPGSVPRPTAGGPSAAPGRRRPLRRVLPLAAAAAALLLALPLAQRIRVAAEPGWPAPPLLREGTGSEALAWPRGTLLALPGAPLARHFELEPVPGAAEYRVHLRLHGGGAFEAGEPIGELRAAAPFLALPELGPGRYTFSAWARVDGLERHLGERDFAVVEQPELAARVARAAAGEGTAPVLPLLRELDGLGLSADARALARLLPPSPAREAYLDARRR